ncbi:MAG: hypothetical protein Q7J54_00870 [Candidatus Woesearchaeota archaeon]|nr:hypothetical protein [Candidatus Woesearchaeota archaeon]
MNVKDLESKQGNVDIVLDIVEVSPPREFSKFGRTGKVANVIAKDHLGDKIKITLWNDQIETVKAGDKVHIKNGYVNEWQGEKQLTTGKFGTLEVVSSSAPSEKKEPEESKEIFSNIVKENEGEDIDLEEEEI